MTTPLTAFMDEGHVALAIALKNSGALYHAFGRGDPDWLSTRQVVQFFAGDRLTLAHHPVSAVTVFVADGATAYASPADYTVDAAAGVITRVDGGALAAGQQVQVGYTVGLPPIDRAAPALRDEIGRRPVTEVHFVLPDAAGDIVIPGTGRFVASETPTRFLRVRTVLDFDDAVDETIREIGLFAFTDIVPDRPPGQTWFTPAELVDPGRLLMFSVRPPLFRAAGTQDFINSVVIL